MVDVWTVFFGLYIFIFRNVNFYLRDAAGGDGALFCGFFFLGPFELEKDWEGQRKGGNCE